MKPKMICKLAIDFIMSVLLLVLMAYVLTGQELHEWLGTAMFILFVAHHVLNIKWYKNLLKGKYTPFRIFQTATNILLLAAMIGLMVSGIILSRYVFGFLDIRRGISFARKLHMLVSYWGFILMSLHIGLHWDMIMGIARKVMKTTFPSKGRTMIFRGITALIAAYGIYAFAKHDIASYLFLKSQFVFFDFEQPPIFFFAEHLAMMGLWVSIAYYISRGIQCPLYKSKSRLW